MSSAASTEKPLSVAAVAAELGQLSRRFDLEVMAECDSTNARLLLQAESGAPSGRVLAALRQTAGRGRRGRSWFSGADDSLTFSLLWRPPPDTALAGLSLAVGVALARAFEGLGLPGIALKWPNDVLLSGRKLAGVLIELASGARPQAVVIGIGINLRRPPDLPEDLKLTAAALADLGLPLPTASALLARVLEALSEVLARFAAEGFSSVRNQWLEKHALQGCAVRLLSDFAEPLEGFCRGVDSDGALLLETAAGTQRVISGEVTLRPA